MNGGADSWNMLVPHSECTRDGAAHDYFAEYQTVRGSIAVAKDSLLPIEADASAQPCRKFGVHPRLERVKALYDAGDAAFVVNAGPLVELLTRDEFMAKTKQIPANLYAHNAQQIEAKQVHARATGTPKGIMGRMVEALQRQDAPYRSGAYSMNGIHEIFDGDFPPTIVGQAGRPCPRPPPTSSASNPDSSAAHATRLPPPSSPSVSPPGRTFISSSAARSVRLVFLDVAGWGDAAGGGLAA